MTKIQEAHSGKDHEKQKGILVSMIDTRIVTIATVVLAVAAVLALFQNCAGGRPGAEQGSHAQSTVSAPQEFLSNTPTASPSSSGKDPVEATEEAAPLFTAGCWLDNAQTSCEAKHDSELADIVPCVQDGLLQFMGGSSSVDVLRSTLTLEPAESGCWIRGIEPRTRQSLANILGVSAGDAYRKCRAKPTGSEVSCDTPHFEEQIYVGGSDSVDCELQFTNYVGRDFGKFSRQLEIISIPGTSSACWVRTRVTNDLIASLRNLKDRPLPFQDP